MVNIQFLGLVSTPFSLPFEVCVLESLVVPIHRPHDAGPRLLEGDEALGDAVQLHARFSIYYKFQFLSTAVITAQLKKCI